MNATLLVVGAAASTCATIEASLAGLGVEVVTADSGNKALELVCERPFAFAIVSHSLRDMDGLELASLIHGDNAHQHMPIVLIATDAQWEAVVYRGHEAGVVDVLSLPIRRGLLRTKAQMYLRLNDAITRERHQTKLLEQSNRQFRDFAHSAAHDLRAPLRAIGGYFGLLQRAAPDDSQRGHYAAAIHSATERMGTLIDDMLEYARVGGATVSREAVDLQSCIRAVVDDCAALFEESGACLESDALPMLSGNRSHLHRLLQNIVANAIKYRSPKRPPEISVRCKLVGSSAEIRIQDNGIGFEMARCEDVFKAFHRLGPQDGSGSGVGLATAKRIVETHGGAIGAISEVGVGSTFVVSLPMTAIEVSDYRRRCERAGGKPVFRSGKKHGAGIPVAACAPEPEVLAPPPAQRSGKGPRLMVVDDSDLDRELTCIALQDRFDLVVVRNPAQALDALDDGIDAVLSDYNMPGNDGLWLLAQLAERRPGIRRLLMTGSLDDACNEALQSGLAFQVFEKPVGETDVASAFESERRG